MRISKVEIWGGVECSVVRIAEQYRNQIVETGHISRTEDLDCIAELGIRTIRYPILWETVESGLPSGFDWQWTDSRLLRLRELGIEVIAGLLHHGSGPRHTDLLDPNFPRLLANYAGEVARRYPWINKFTVVNEPLTTARFSCLYGHWYPHERDEGAFFRALVNQCLGTLLAMREIRKATPDACLVQTEDLGKIFSSSDLQYQADYENQRRWLSFDLLMGRVRIGHPFYGTFLSHGVKAADLAQLASAEGEPEIIGINYYATSDRYLDSDLASYPSCFAGGNAYSKYADVEAVRVDVAPHELGAKARLSEAWDRYGKPVAITEAHHGSTRDEQVRWLLELWRAAEGLREEGADVRAVTVWSLFGAVDWNSLLVKRSGFYEPGAFDVRSGAPRRTAVGTLTEKLARRECSDHAVLQQSGWWRRDIRYYKKRDPVVTETASQPLLVIGGTGTLGKAFSRICDLRGLPCVVLSRLDLDIIDSNAVELAIAMHKPWAVINAAGYVRVAEAEREPNLCFDGNVTGAVNLARVCAKKGLQFATFSTDLVFDGALDRAYLEGDETRPQCVYGMSKAVAERQIATIYADALVVRSSAFFGPWDRANFVWQTLRCLSDGLEWKPDNAIVSPTYVPDLVNATLDLLIDRESGLWHLANDGMSSWDELAERAARQAGFSWTPTRHDCSERTRSTALSSARGVMLPKLDDALARFFHECEVDWGQGGRA